MKLFEIVDIRNGDCGVFKRVFINPEQLSGVVETMDRTLMIFEIGNSAHLLSGEPLNSFMQRLETLK